ncbi:MAG TPA: hypothetical protein VGB17_18820 [Pyrinomonadaceae bacterium]|jgi:hypothetical protein
MFKRNFFTISVSVLCLLLGLNPQVSLAAICIQGTQVSETYTSGGSKTFNFDVNNLDIKRLDLFIELTGITANPSFTVAIDNNVGDGLPAAGVAMSVPSDQFFQFTDNGTTYTDTATLQRINPADPNHYLLSILFGSYYGLCGPKCELGEVGCTPATALPSANRRQRTVTVTIAGMNANGHLQVNGVSKKCIGAPESAGLPAEALVTANPAKAFIDSGVAACPAAKATDVVVVLDHSGSMVGSATGPGVAPPTRIDVLNQSMDTFFDIWKQAGQFNPVDKVGAVFFNDPAVIRNFPVPTFLITFTATPNTNPSLDNLITESTTHVIDTNQLTAMGQALQATYTGCTTPGDTSCSPKGGFNDTSTNFRHIVLFTDGMQTAGPDVIVPASVDAPLTLSGVELRARAIPVHTIGTGYVTGSEYQTLLKRLSLDTGGRHTFTATPIVDMSNAFLTTLVSIFRGNTLGIVDYKNATIARGAGQAQHQFLINRSAKRVVFLISWHAENPADQNPNALTMEVFRPGSNVPVAVGINTDANHHHIKNITIPLPDGPAAHEGLWTVRVKESLTGPSQVYDVAALVDESRLEYNLGAVAGNYSTGAPIHLQATVTEDGTPVKNLSSVTARVTRPRSALGTLLHNRQFQDLGTNPAPLPADTFPDNYSRKLFRLANDPTVRALLAPITDAQPLILLDNGLDANGDAVAGDGIYSALLPGTNTRLPGQYVFEMSVAGNTPALGNFSRTEKSSALVRVLNPDKVKSEVAIDATLAAPGEYLMTIVPADAFENFLGPGFANSVEVSVNPAAGVTVGPVTDPREDGSYNVKLTGVSGNPTVTVKVLGKEIASKTISQGKIPRRRYAIFGGIGANIPHGELDNFFDTGISTQLGFEYRFTNRVSAEGTFGYDRFNFSGGGGVRQHFYRGSANLKFYPVIGTFQLGFFGGGGVYVFDPGASVHGGVNFGSVAEYRINTSWSVEATYNFHNVFTTGENVRFSTAQGGFRFRF